MVFGYWSNSWNLHFPIGYSYLTIFWLQLFPKPYLFIFCSWNHFYTLFKMKCSKNAKDIYTCCAHMCNKLVACFIQMGDGSLSNVNFTIPNSPEAENRVSFFQGSGAEQEHRARACSSNHFLASRARAETGCERASKSRPNFAYRAALLEHAPGGSFFAACCSFEEQEHCSLMLGFLCSCSARARMRRCSALWKFCWSTSKSSWYRVRAPVSYTHLTLPTIYSV